MQKSAFTGRVSRAGQVFRDLLDSSEGDHTLKVTVNSKNNIYEDLVNENNNTQTITLTVPFLAIDKIKDMKTKQPIPVPVPGVR